MTIGALGLMFTKKGVENVNKRTSNIRTGELIQRIVLLGTAYIHRATLLICHTVMTAKHFFQFVAGVFQQAFLFVGCIYIYTR